MEYNAPHPSAAFEGWYSKFLLPSGATLALIICSVHKGTENPHMVSFNYIPLQNSEHHRYQIDLWTEKIIYTKKSKTDHAFEITIPDVGEVVVDGDSTTTYDLHCNSFTFRAKTSTREPWNASMSSSSPEGWVASAPIPLHWHVHSLSSLATFTLTIPSIDNAFPSVDRLGSATVHQEKNWADSFPSAHIWLQAKERDGRGLCGAGGLLLGAEAAYIGYRNPKLDVSVDFRPPFALRVFNRSLFMSLKTDWSSRAIDLCIQNFSHKLVVKASAKDGTFFSLPAPFEEGIRTNFLAESFQSRLAVEVFEKKNWTRFLGLGTWNLLVKDEFDRASMEFGGGYYPSAGVGEKRIV